MKSDDDESDGDDDVAPEERVVEGGVSDARTRLRTTYIPPHFSPLCLSCV